MLTLSVLYLQKRRLVFDLFLLITRVIKFTVLLIWALRRAKKVQCLVNKHEK